MLKRTRLVAAFCIVLFSSAASWATSEAWMTDFDVALAKAKKDKKFLLVNFTGKDWCPPCKMLEGEVFHQKEFQREAGKHFVLVELDFPRSQQQMAKQTQRERARNEGLTQKHGIQGFPTVLLMDSQERPFGRTGYQPGGAQAYLKHLEPYLKNEVKKTELKAHLQGEGISDTEKAKLLDAMIDLTAPEYVESHHLDDMKLIIELDAGNALGLKHKYLYSFRLRQADEAFRNQQFDKVIDLLQGMIKELNPEGQHLQELHYYLGMVYESFKDYSNMITHLRAAIDAEPEGYYARSVKQILDMHLVEGGHVESTLPPTWYDLFKKAADGNSDSYFRSSRNLIAGDTLSLVLNPERSVKQISVTTGSPDFAQEVLHNGVLETSADGKIFKKIGQFKDGLAQISWDTPEKINVVRLRATADQSHPLVVREIVLK